MELLHHIHVVRDQNVMLDADLAVIYGVETKRLNEAVKRNQDRFPADFMFRLTTEEWNDLRSQFATSSEDDDLRSPNVTSSEPDPDTYEAVEESLSSVNWGGRRYPPYAFTEHGAVMLSSVLRSERAVAASIQVVRAFVRMRQFLLTQEELSRRLLHLEAATEENFQIVFDAINELMTERDTPRRRIGFKPDND